MSFLVQVCLHASKLRQPSKLLKKWRPYENVHCEYNQCLKSAESNNSENRPAFLSMMLLVEVSSGQEGCRKLFFTVLVLSGCTGR